MALGKRFAAIAAVMVAGCYSPYQEFNFVGRVYDGASGLALTSYSIGLQYGTQSVTGTVDASGRYNVGPLPPYSDYTITITANGYRPFLSHNAFRSSPGTDTQVSLYYDAYLYPTDASTPAVTFNISLSESSSAPAGNVRFQPSAQPSLVSGTAAVGDQVWINSADLQAETKNYTFSNGTLTIPAGDLLYGVTYEVAIYGVPGYGETDTTFVAGSSGNQSFVLSPYEATPLALAYDSASSGQLTPNGSLTLVFNQPIKLNPTATQASVTDALNTGFSIQDGTTADGGTAATLNGGTQNGVSFAITGSTLTLSWNPSTGLKTGSIQDIASVTYGNLDLVPIGASSGATFTGTSVGFLVGSSVTVDVAAQ